MPRPDRELLGALKIARLATHVVVGLGLSAAVFPWVGARGRGACFRWWSRRILAILAVRPRMHGQWEALPADTPRLLVSNHVSWLDIFVIRSAVACRFVAKSEIRRWPLVGWLVSRQGTVFVERARRQDTGRVNATLQAALRGGDAVVVFAEGTTSDGSRLNPFHGSLLQPLVDLGGLALPVALRYAGADGAINLEASYAGDRSLWQSVRLLAAQREIVVDLHLLTPVDAAGRHRRELARHCAERVAEALRLPPPDRAPGRLPGPPDAGP